MNRAMQIASAIGAVAVYLLIGSIIGESLGSFMMGLVVESTIFLAFVPFLSKFITPKRRRSA